MTARAAFDLRAVEYERVRPDYPSQLYDALESAMGQPLLTAEVLDVGAGTGEASRGLAGRGAHVVALDPTVGMLEMLRSRSTSRVRPVVGDGSHLPFRQAAFDLVVFAASLSRTDMVWSPGEALRVLKPRGVVAACWNSPDLTVPWFAEHQRRLCAALGRQMQANDPAPVRALAQPPYYRDVACLEIPSSRHISLEDYGRLLRSQSGVPRGGDPAETAVEQELRVLEVEFPGLVIEEPFITHVVLARA